MDEHLNIVGVETLAESDGIAPRLDGDTAKYLRSDGTWSVVSDDKASLTEGTGAAYTATDISITALEPGVTITIIPHITSTVTSPTLDVNGLGAKSIRQRLTNATGTTVSGASSDWIDANKPLKLTYDGTFWVADLSRPEASSIYGDVRGEQVKINSVYAGDMTLQEFYGKNFFTWSMVGRVPGSHSGWLYINSTPDNKTLSFNGNVYYDKANNAWMNAVRVPGLEDSYGWWIKTSAKIVAPSKAMVFYGVGFSLNPSNYLIPGNFNNTRAAVGTDGYIYICNMEQRPANPDDPVMLAYTGRWVDVDGRYQ